MVKGHPANSPKSLGALTAALAGSLVSVWPPAINAQQSIRGLVAEVETTEPISRAVLLLMEGDGGVYGSALSDSAGQFEINIATPGRYFLRVNRLGYNPTQSGVIDVPANTVVEVRVNLRPDPLLLDAVTVHGEASLTPQLREFYARRRQRRGYNFSPTDFERLNATTVMDLLPEIPGFRYHGTQRNRRIELNFRRCMPAVFLDGYEPRLDSLEVIHLIETLPLGYVHGVEVFRNWSDVPGEFAAARRGRARCGVIVIWTVEVER